MAKTASNEKKQGTAGSSQFLFGKTNFRLMLIGLGVIFLGFYLMAGKEDIFSSTKLILAPIVVLAGFGIEFFAIMRAPDQNQSES